MGRKPLQIDDLKIADEAKSIFGVRSEADDPKYLLRPKNNYVMTILWLILRLLENKDYRFTDLYSLSGVDRGTFRKYLRLLIRFRFVEKNSSLYHITEKGRSIISMFREG